MGLHSDTLPAIESRYPAAFVHQGAVLNAHVVIVDATERFMYLTPADELPRDCLHVYHLVEQFITDKIRRVCIDAPRVVAVLIDDTTRVPLEKGVAHAARYGRAAAPKPLDMSGPQDGSGDLQGTEHALPWEQVERATMEKSNSAAWREIISTRAIRQRLAKFCKRKLIESATLGLPPGSRIFVSGPGPEPTPACHVVTVGGEDTPRNTAPCPPTIFPPNGAGEADIQTPLFALWALAQPTRQSLQLPDNGAVVAVMSKDSDMIPILVAQQTIARATNPNIRDHIHCFREKYERVTKRWTSLTINTSCIASVLARSGGTDSVLTPVLNLLYSIALCGCDFVKRPKAFSTTLALHTTEDPTVMQVDEIDTDGTATIQIKCSASNARTHVQNIWSQHTRCPTAARPKFLSESLQIIKQSKGGGRYRINDKDKTTTEAACRAAIWVALYWIAPALGTDNVQYFSNAMCSQKQGASVSEHSQPYGFETTLRDGKCKVKHATEKNTQSLSLPTALFKHPHLTSTKRKRSQ